MRSVLVVAAVLALSAWAAPPASAQGQAEVVFDRAPREVDLGPQGAARVPVTVLLQVASGCEDATLVPVALSAEPTDGLRATFDRAEALLRIPAGSGPHEAREEVSLHVTGVGPGVLTLHAQPRLSPESCLGLSGAATPATWRLEAPGPAAPEGRADAGGTRPIALEHALLPPVLPAVLLVAAGVGALVLALRARPWRGT